MMMGRLYIFFFIIESFVCVHFTLVFYNHIMHDDTSFHDISQCLYIAICVLDLELLRNELVEL
jgi:hypothetical protein